MEKQTVSTKFGTKPDKKAIGIILI